MDPSHEPIPEPNPDDNGVEADIPFRAGSCTRRPKLSPSPSDSMSTTARLAVARLEQQIQPLPFRLKNEVANEGVFGANVMAALGPIVPHLSASLISLTGDRRQECRTTESFEKQSHRETAFRIEDTMFVARAPRLDGPQWCGRDRGEFQFERPCQHVRCSR
jgi:hypothetical protein